MATSNDPGDLGGLFAVPPPPPSEIPGPPPTPARTVANALERAVAEHTAKVLAAAVAEAGSRANARSREANRIPAPRRTIQERFEQFHRDNPAIYAEFVRLADLLLEKHRAGRVAWVSAKHIFERMRSDYYFADTTSDAEPFRLSNDFTSRYARLLISDRPEFASVLRTRELETR